MKNLTQIERNFFFSRDPQNLVNNPSYESNTTGWTLEGDFARSSEEASTGTYSIKQTSTSNYSNLLTEDAGISVVPGKSYTASYYAKVTVNSGNPPKFRITHIDKYGDSGINGGVTLVEDDVIASGSFTRRLYSFTAPTNKVWFRIFNNNGNVTAFYDYFKISPNRSSLELNDVKRSYFIDQTGLPSNSGISELERAWLRKLVVANGGTPSGKYTSDLLKQALSQLGLPVTKFDDQNYQTLYANYTGA